MENQLRQLQQEVSSLRSEIASLKSFRQEINTGRGVTNNDLTLDSGSKLIIGPALFTDGFNSDEATSAIVSTGRDKSVIGGVDNSQLTLIRLASGNSVVYGLGGKVIYGSDASFKTGGTEIKSDKFNLVDEGSLVGHYITVSMSDGSLLNLAITANSRNTVTTSPIVLGNKNANFVVYKPVFLGGEEYPWQKLYVHGGISAGIQFGGGTNGNGANGILYATGNDIRYRAPSGADVKLN